jgi:hypothetical protein
MIPEIIPVTILMVLTIPIWSAGRSMLPTTFPAITPVKHPIMAIIKIGINSDTFSFSATCLKNLAGLINRYK